MTPIPHRARFRNQPAFLIGHPMAYDEFRTWQHSNLMVFRLLYRLLLQSLNRRADAELGESAAAGRPAAGIAAPRPRRHAATVLALVLGACVLAAAVLAVLRPTMTTDSGGPGAALHLSISADGPKPVVAYLRGGDPDRPRHGEETSPVRRIRSVDGRFSPAFQVAPPLSVLEMTNADSVAHNTHMFSRGETVFNVALPEQGVTVRKVLRGDGIFDIRCDMHPWMRAWVFVSPSPHYAVVHEPTTIAFTGIDPGGYILHLWQPNRRESIHPLELVAGETRHLRLR